MDEMKLTMNGSVNIRQTDLQKDVEYKFPTYAKTRKVSYFKRDELWTVIWQATEPYQERVTLTAYLDQGSNPTADGDGMSINGHRVKINFLFREKGKQ